MVDINYISLALSLVALIISVATIIILFYQSQIQKGQYDVESETLSLEMFLRSLEHTGTNEAREARDYIFKFPDLTNQTSSISSDETVEVYIQDREGKIKEYTHNFVIPTGDDWKKITDVAVRIDRVGFILFNIKLSKTIKEAYLEWWCSTIVDSWNRLAPYIYLKRSKRENYTPYFEKLSKEAFPYYYNRKNDAKLVLLEKPE
ncbi:MAG: hypothetical protein ABSB80_08685 [Methanoregula sp.]|jgi:hypothetical protein|uniref:hypothetical protein n=1 Tax=Methanoregula sp. TaxID=2052170 RepID=UPI003D13E2A8